MVPRRRGLHGLLGLASLALGASVPRCGRAGTRLARGRVWRCGACDKRVSRTAGTILQDTRTPLTVWFAAAWYMTADPGGVSALTMQKLLGWGSYQTAWTMLHRYRTAMVRPRPLDTQ